MEQRVQPYERLAPPIAPRTVPPMAGWTGRSDSGEGVSIVSPGARLRALVEGTEGSLSALERQAAALHVAALNRQSALVEYYRERLREIGATPRLIAAVERRAAAGLSSRLAAILHHARLVADGPRVIRCAHVRALRQEGLTAEDVTALTRLAAFVSYQAGILVDLGRVEE